MSDGRLPCIVLECVRVDVVEIAYRSRLIIGIQSSVRLSSCI